MRDPDLLRSWLKQPPQRILEVGSWKGGSACSFLREILSDDGLIICVDPFNVSDECPFAMDLVPGNSAIEKEFWHNVTCAKKPNQRIELRYGRSYTELARLVTEQQKFDLVYIDGNHCANAVMADACMCFGMLEPGGIMLFDDYDWKDPIGVNGQPMDLLDRPKIAIDFFTTLFYRNTETLWVNYQYAIRKWNN